MADFQSEQAAMPYNPDGQRGRHRKVRVGAESRRQYALFALAVCLGMKVGAPTACGQESNLATPPSDVVRKVSLGVLVTLDVFSGRPNPSWSLSADEEQELVRRLQGLPSGDGPPTEGDLGYRGFRLVARAPRSTLPSEVVVTKGMVTIRENGRTRHYIDANGIESWLLDQARRHGHGPLVAGH
jgi:hypothetical protein